MASCDLMTYKLKTSYLLPTQPLNSSKVETGKQPLKTHKRGEQETLCQADIKGHCTGRIKAPLAGPRVTWRAICHPLQLSGRKSLSIDLHGHIQRRIAEGGLLGDSTAFVTYLTPGTVLGDPQDYGFFTNRILSSTHS